MKKTPQSSLNSRPLRSAGSTAAIAAALMTANADIVYVDDLNVTLASSVNKGDSSGPLDSRAISINGTPAFTAELQVENGVTPPPVIGMSGFTNGFQSYEIAKSPGSVVIFAEGMTIDGSFPAVSQSDTNLSGIWTTASTSKSFPATYFIGFEFDPTGSQTLYGWMEIRFESDAFSSSSSSFTLTRYAYEDSGAPIAAGALPVPGGVIFRDNLNLSAAEDKGTAGVTPVDIDDDGVVDFELRSNPFNNEVGFSGVTNFLYIVTGDPNGEAKLFAGGENIDGVFNPFSDATALNTWFLGAADGDTAYVGFEFFTGVTDVFGWAELERTSSTTLTLLRLAYHYDDGPIAAGETGLEAAEPLRVLATEYVPDTGGGIPAFRVTVPGRTGFLYQLRRSPDLVTPFGDIGTPLPGGDVALVLEDPTPLPDRGFYEVIETEQP